MPNKTRAKWIRPFAWPPHTWEFTPGMQIASEILTALVFLLVLGTVLGALILWPILICKTLYYVSVGKPDDVRNTLLAVGALIGVPFIVWRTLIAARQTDIARESHYTALFTKAVEQLGADKVVKHREFKPVYQTDTAGSPLRDEEGDPIVIRSPDGSPVGEYQTYEVSTTNYEVRLGAIYALERIAQDSKRDAWPIFQTLCAYVQNNAAVENGSGVERKGPDIEEIFAVLNRYDGPRQEPLIVQFRKIAVRQLSLRGKSFNGIAFIECKIDSLVCISNMKEVSFMDCQTVHAHFHNCEVARVYFTEGSGDKFRLSSVTADDILVSSINFGKFEILKSNIKFGRFNLNYAGCDIVSNKFENCRFIGAETAGTASGSPRVFSKNVFDRCVFEDCNLSIFDFSENEYLNCEFRNCNLFGVSEIKNSGSLLSSCFIKLSLRFKRLTDISCRRMAAVIHSDGRR